MRAVSEANALRVGIALVHMGTRRVNRALLRGGPMAAVLGLSENSLAPACRGPRRVYVGTSGTRT